MTAVSAYADSPAESSSDGQVYRDYVVAPLTQFGCQPVPVPRHASGAGNLHKRSHGL